uniref:Uncharacterized protein n=1 Tax=Noctiluca scintillans TaxID=2966 RepID=A0A7S1FKD7_NOCSC
MRKVPSFVIGGELSSSSVSEQSNASRHLLFLSIRTPCPKALCEEQLGMPVPANHSDRQSCGRTARKTSSCRNHLGTDGPLEFRSKAFIFELKMQVMNTNTLK